MSSRQIHVYADWIALKGPLQVGTLFVETLRGKEIFSFEYERSWLDRDEAQSLDPALVLFEGRQHLSGAAKNFGIFLDSSPDRWGRRLMNRKEAQNARREKRAERTLLESDFLLGVFDRHRMGALRFRTDKSGPFLDSDEKHASPPWVKLRDLEHASRVVEKKSSKESEISEAINLLIAPGSSLGGARPKSSVVDEHGALWIAKFPSPNDLVDVGAWEMLTHELAHKAGIVVPEARLEKYSEAGHTFISRRFDRNSLKNRRHFASAMTLLQHSDGDNFESGASYLELVEFLSSNGSRPDEDIKQLWRRILFSVCVSNTDDHLRNHGFMLEDHGWYLAPAYDINPVATGDGLSLNISLTDNAQDLALLRETAGRFRIKPKEVELIINEVTSAVLGWRKIASRLKIPKSEQDSMAAAFRVAHRGT